MSLNHSPSIVRENLLLNLDMKNPKRFSTDLGNNNLVQDWKYNAATWTTSIYSSNTAISSGIDAPDGTSTAARITCSGVGTSILRVNFTGFTPNGADTYICSFWVRKIGGTSGGSFSSDLHDEVSLDYTSQLVTNKWIRVVYSGIPTATSKTFIDLLSGNQNNYTFDFWGVKVEKKDETVTYMLLEDTVGGYQFKNYRPYLTTMDQDSITFDRIASPKEGSLLYSTMTGALTAANFLYNDHTMEIWFKINDITFIGSSTEANNILVRYRGFHAGLHYTPSTMIYSIWNSTTEEPSCATWTVGTSGAQINQGIWYQLAVTNNNGKFTPYINGVMMGTGFTPTISASGMGTSNDLHLGASQIVAANTGSFCHYSKNTISNLKMYNKALSPSEINQNFNALRGRFGI